MKKMIPLKLSGIREGGIKERDGGEKFNYDTFDTL
jgi:hypothetical protein